MVKNTPGPWKIHKHTENGDSEGYMVLSVGDVLGARPALIAMSVLQRGDARAISQVPEMINLLADVANGEHGEGLKSAARSILSKIEKGDIEI